MKLSEIIKKDSLVIIGINSGTSANGADLAALKVSPGKNRLKIAFLAGLKRAYPEKLKEAVLKLSSSSKIAIDELIFLDNALGIFFGKAAESLINKLKRFHHRVDAVASHGQTVRHIPGQTDYLGHKLKASLQIGSLSQIAKLTDKTTVGDFRQADIALGGEGAPITVAAMEKLFAHPKESRLIINIGGIANYFYFPSNNSLLNTKAADCGPGNSLCDLLARRLYNKKFDNNGTLARRGKISSRLLTFLISLPSFKFKTVSTGRETFGWQMADKIIEFGERFKIKSEDLMATAAELTVISISQKILPLVNADNHIRKVYLSGGGGKNIYFMDGLKCNFPNLEICSIKELGFDPDIVEPVAYAVMGYTCLKSVPLRTNFRKTPINGIQPVLGKIAQPPGKIKK